MENTTLYHVLFAYLFVLAIAIIFITSSRQRAKREFFKSLTNKIQANLITTKNDVSVLINSINRKYAINYPILYYLEDYLTHISTFKPAFKKEYQDLLNEIVTSEQVDKPFDGVPEEEKRLLININSAIKSQNLDAISYNLHELGTVLSTRNRIHSRNAKINQWSIPLAIAGLVVTIAFGYLSLQGINYEKIKDINKKAIQEVVSSKDSI